MTVAEGWKFVPFMLMPQQTSNRATHGRGTSCRQVYCRRVLNYILNDGL